MRPTGAVGGDGMGAPSAAGAAPRGASAGADGLAAGAGGGTAVRVSEPDVLRLPNTAWSPRFAYA